MADIHSVQPAGGKPFYKTWWGLLLIVLFFPIVIPYLVWTKTSWNKWVKIGVTAACACVLIVGFTGSDQGSTARPTVTQRPVQPTADAIQVEPKSQYEQLGYENNAAVENFYVL